MKKVKSFYEISDALMLYWHVRIIDNWNWMEIFEIEDEIEHLERCKDSKYLEDVIRGLKNTQEVKNTFYKK